jgi:hypothetical protein
LPALSHSISGNSSGDIFDSACISQNVSNA